MGSDRQTERLLLLLDVLTIVLALPLAGLLRASLSGMVPGLKPTVPAAAYVHLLLVFVPTWSLCAEQVGLQRLRVVSGPWLEVSRALLWAQGLGALAITLILVAAQEPFNRSLIVIFLTASTLLLLVMKAGQRAWLRRRRGEALALVVGDLPGEARAELEQLRRRALEDLAPATPEGLRQRLRQGGVDEVVLAASVPRAVVRPLLEECERVGIPAMQHLERLDLELVRPRAESVGTALYLSYEVPTRDQPTRFVKALLDRVGAAFLLVASFPLLVLVAALVKLTSPGPVLFVQERGGLNGRPFRMLKFRTMRDGAEAERAALLARNEMDGPVFKIADDPRVTRIGRLLRRTSLDELPQLVNVLLGDMSLVGPRPLPLVETVELDGIQRRRLSMRPGVTCLWQVSGRNQLGFQQWMALDLEYVDRWSLGLDLAILLRTVPALLTRRGAA